VVIVYSLCTSLQSKGKRGGHKEQETCPGAGKGGGNMLGKRGKRRKGRKNRKVGVKD